MADSLVQLRCGVKVRFDVALIAYRLSASGGDCAADIVNAERPVGQDGQGVPFRSALVEDSRKRADRREPDILRGEEGRLYYTTVGVTADPICKQLWMGTYPSNPSYVLSTGEPLEDYIKRNPQVLGPGSIDRWGTQIPFLPKVEPSSRTLRWTEPKVANQAQGSLVLQSSLAPGSSR